MSTKRNKEYLIAAGAVKLWEEEGDLLKGELLFSSVGPVKLIYGL